MQTLFYRLLKNSFILQNLETQSTQWFCFQLAWKKKKWLGQFDKSSNIQSYDQCPSTSLMILAYAIYIQRKFSSSSRTQLDLTELLVTNLKILTHMSHVLQA